MADLNEILRLNPQAAVGMGDIRETLSNLNDLRAAGIIKVHVLSRPDGGRKTIEQLKSAQRRSVLR